MILDLDEKIFLVQVGTRGKKQKPIYAEFRFKPYILMERLLDDYNIKYQESDKRFSGVYLVQPGQQPLTSYKVEVRNKDITSMKYHYFYFTSDIREKVLDYYKVKYKKGVGYND